MKLTSTRLKKLIVEVLDEGILDQMKAEKHLRDQYFRVRDLHRQGKASEEELRVAYDEMTNMDTDQFYTADELASAAAEREEQEQRYQDRLDREDAQERAKERRLNRDRISALKMRSGYRDRGIDMGPDDPGDVDDLYPDLREASEDEVPQEAKDELFKRLVKQGAADPKMGHTADDVLANEVEKDSEDYKTFKAAGLLVKVGDKFYVGEY